MGIIGRLVHRFNKFASKFNGNTTNKCEFLEVGATLISVHIPETSVLSESTRSGIQRNYRLVPCPSVVAVVCKSVSC